MIHPGFSEAEYGQRVSDLQAGLAARGLSGAILTAEANYNYFAGYHHFAPWTTFCRPVFLLIPTVGSPVMFVHGFPLMDARRDTWFPDVRGYDDLMYAPIDLVIKAVDELGMRSGPIGMELGAEHRHRAHGRRARRPPRLAGARARGRHRHADLGHPDHQERGRDRAPPRVRTNRGHGLRAVLLRAPRGDDEDTAASVLGEAITAEGGRPGFFIVTSGQGFYDRTAGLPRDRVLERGDMLWIDLGVVYRGYWTDHCRAATIGPASQGQRDNWNAMRQLTWSAVEQVRANRTPPETGQPSRVRGGQHGPGVQLQRRQRCGHGIGLMSTEPPHIARTTRPPCSRA